MRYAITGLTYTNEYEAAVEIISRKQGITPESFRRAVHNIFTNRETAQETLDELNAHQLLRDCGWQLKEIA